MTEFGRTSSANFYISGEEFTITYAGGDGNDLVLTRIPTPPRPVLTIQRLAPSSVRLLWPSNFTGYTLQFTTNLNAAKWIPAPPLPVVSGTNNVLNQAVEGPTRFYRLSKPSRERGAQERANPARKVFMGNLVPGQRV